MASYDLVPVDPNSQVAKDLLAVEKANSMQADVKYAQENPGASLMSRAKEQSAKEATQVSGQLTRNIAVPLAQTALALGTGGMSIPAQIAINAGTEYGLQQAGINPESTAQVVGAAAGPVVGSVIQRTVKGVGRALANVSGKGEMAGEQAAAKVLKVPTEGIERSTYAPSKALYQEVEQRGMVDTSQALSAVQDAIFKEQSLGSQANKQTLKYLQGLAEDLSPKVGESVVEDAATLTARAQRLAKAAEQAERRGNSTLAATLRDAAGQFKGGIPGLKEADVAYTRERVVDDLFKAMRKGNKLKAIDDYIAENGAKVRNVISDKDLRDIRKIAATVVDLGGAGGEAGILKTAYEGVLRSFLTDPNGLTVFRHAFGPDLGKMTPAGISGLMTFIRGYEAQKGRQ